MKATWTFGVCEYCLKNLHEEVRMVREKLISTDGKHSEEVWCCPVCGSNKKL